MTRGWHIASVLKYTIHLHGLHWKIFWNGLAVIMPNLGMDRISSSFDFLFKMLICSLIQKEPSGLYCFAIYLSFCLKELRFWVSVSEFQSSWSVLSLRDELRQIRPQLPVTVPSELLRRVPTDAREDPYSLFSTHYIHRIYDLLGLSMFRVALFSLAYSSLHWNYQAETVLSLFF